jgi:hypothetical protein
MSNSERAQDERRSAEEDVMEDLELSAEAAGEAVGGTDPAPPSTTPIVRAWPRKLGG